MKLEAVLTALPALAELSKVKLPAKTAYRVAKNYGAFAAEAKLFEDQRMKLLTDLGTPREDDPNTYDLGGANAAEFQREIADLLATEVDVPLMPITITDLNDAAIEATILMALGDIVTE